ncbi:hypothetical protein B0H17DRAFT_1144710 [Mycena rosella]|uniref:Uncharacterized protein n=1 Tax=Mycena rosella TaxID=1033263 RepID=A0AAD7CSV4_MYCRO|nr:hypothetical protein B0H17DRAFT_1144710 [Mycena rosella]
MRWLSHTIQSTVGSSPSASISRTPSAPRPVPSSTPIRSASAHSSPIPSIPRPLNSLHTSSSLRQDVLDIPDSDADDPPPAPLLKRQKRKRSTSKVDDAISVSSDSDSRARIESKKKGKKCAKHSKSEGQVIIFKQLSCSELGPLTDLPKPCWTVPRPEEDYAYLLDMSDDPREWVDKKKELLSLLLLNPRYCNCLVCITSTYVIVFDQPK